MKSIETKNDVPVIHRGDIAVLWQKYLSLNGFIKSLNKSEKIYQITDLGQTGVVNANLRPTKGSGITFNTFH